MAEVVGIVASGISIGQLAGQITSSVVKLKSYWDQIKETPDDIYDLIEEIEDLNLVLADIEDNQNATKLPPFVLDKTSATKSLQHCIRGADRLKELVDDMGRDINAPSRMRRKIAAAKVVLKNDKIEKYRARLARSIQLLSLSYQCYTRALMQLQIQRQPDIIISRMKEVMKPPEDLVPVTATTGRTSFEAPQDLAASSLIASAPFPETFGGVRSWDDRTRKGLIVQTGEKRAKRRQQITYGFSTLCHLPYWLTNAAWEFAGYKARSGWKFRLDTYRILPKDSPVFNYAKEGNIEGLQQLFSNGLASPFDRDSEQGKTVLHGAARTGRVDICRLLIQEGADPDAKNFMEETPLQDLCFRSGHLAFEDRISPIDTMRLFAVENEADLLVRDRLGWSALGAYRGPVEGFKLLLQKCNPPFHRLRPIERLDIAANIATGFWENTPELTRMALRPGDLEHAATPRPMHEEQDGAECLLRNIAKVIGLSHACGTIERDSSAALVSSRRAHASRALGRWREFFRDFVIAGIDLHHTCSSKRIFYTPLGWALQRAIAELRRPHVDVLAVLLVSWLEDLSACGVDLKQYGETEKLIHDQGAVRKDFKPVCSWIEEVDYEEYYVLTWRLISFSYGPRPEDWRMWWSEPTDSFAGEYWAMAECPMENMPGSWVE